MSFLIHVEENNTDHTFCQYISDVIPRINETLWIEKVEMENGKKSDEVKVTDIIHVVNRITNYNISHNKIPTLCTVYVMVDRIES